MMTLSQIGSGISIGLTNLTSSTQVFDYIRNQVFWVVIFQFFAITDNINNASVACEGVPECVVTLTPTLPDVVDFWIRSVVETRSERTADISRAGYR
jgi:hypothetical protein